MPRLLTVSTAVIAICLAILLIAQSGHGQGDGSGQGGGEGLGQKVGKKRASFITVLDYGAKGDGIADDTAAIQALIDAKAGTIRFPAGTYRITKPIVVDLDKVGFTSFVADGTAQLVMAGPGPAIRFVGTHGGTAAPESVKPDVWERQRMPAVDGPRDRRRPCRGRRHRSRRHDAAHDPRRPHPQVPPRHSPRRAQPQRADRRLPHLREQRLRRLLDNVNLHQTNISASHISYCGGGGVVVRGGDVRNIHITGCDIEANHGQGRPADRQRAARLRRRQHGRSRHHRLHDPAHQGRPRIGQHPHPRPRLHEAPTAKDCRFNCGHVTIGDNVLSDVQTNIHLVGARGVTITGNTLLAGLCPQPAGRRLAARRRRREHDGAQPALRLHRRSEQQGRLPRLPDCTIQGLHLHHVMRCGGRPDARKVRPHSPHRLHDPRLRQSRPACQGHDQQPHSPAT